VLRGSDYHFTVCIAIRRMGYVEGKNILEQPG
jgi:hypothetical protein